MIPLSSTFRTFSAALRSSWHGACGWTLFHMRRHNAARKSFHRVLEIRGEHFPSYVYLSRIAQAQGDMRGARRESAHARRVAPNRFERLKQRLQLPAPLLAGATPDEAGARATWRPSTGGGNFAPGSRRVPGREPTEFPSNRSHRAPRKDDATGSVPEWISDPADPLGLDDGLVAEALQWFDRIANEPETDHSFDDAFDSVLDDELMAEQLPVDGEFPDADDAECERGRRYGDDFSSDRERIKFERGAPISRAEIESNDLDDLVDRLGAC